MTNDARSWLSGWLSLIRLPNLFTIPGDVAAGYLIAESMTRGIDHALGFSFSERAFASHSFLPALASIILVYCYGLVLNDLADFKEDSRERPERPIPSGTVSKRVAGRAAVLFLLFGLALAAAVNGLFLANVLLVAVLVTAYDVFLKKVPFAGAAVMALCRTLTLTAGYLACRGEFGLTAPPPFLTLACGTWWLYIFAVTVAARKETRPRRMSAFERKIVSLVFYLQLFWVFAAMFVGGGVSAVEAAGEHPPGVLLALGLAVAFSMVSVPSLLNLLGENASPEKAQGSVGRLIRALVFLQASACAFLGYPYVAVGVASLWIPAVITGTRHKSS